MYMAKSTKCRDVLKSVRVTFQPQTKASIGMLTLQTGSFESKDCKHRLLKARLINHLNSSLFQLLSLLVTCCLASLSYSTPGKNCEFKTMKNKLHLLQHNEQPYGQELKIWLSHNFHQNDSPLQRSLPWRRQRRARGVQEQQGLRDDQLPCWSSRWRQQPRVQCGGQVHQVQALLLHQGLMATKDRNHFILNARTLEKDAKKGSKLLVCGHEGWSPLQRFWCCHQRMNTTSARRKRWRRFWTLRGEDCRKCSTMEACFSYLHLIWLSSWGCRSLS